MHGRTHDATDCIHSSCSISNDRHGCMFNSQSIILSLTQRDMHVLSCTRMWTSRQPSRYCSLLWSKMKWSHGS